MIKEMSNVRESNFLSVSENKKGKSNYDTILTAIFTYRDELVKRRRNLGEPAAGTTGQIG
jgi:hypothetical protein